MNKVDRLRISQLARILDVLRGSSPSMPMQHAATFLYIALKPGLAVTELARAMQTHLATTSRHVRALAGLGPGSHAPALVALDFGKDARTKTAVLTEAGQSLMRTVLDLLSKSAPVFEISPAIQRNCDHKSAANVEPYRIPWDPFGCS